ncbi:hypothetical protein ACOSQ2_027203 [Xanthoceras sorbifolium]
MVEAVTLLNKLLDDAIPARVKVEGQLSRLEEENKELNNKVDSYLVLIEGAKVEMEIEVVDCYKNSHIFDAFMHREFRNCMKDCQTFLQPLVDKNVLEDLGVDIANNMNISKIPSQEGVPKIYANNKTGFHFLGGPMDEGPDPDFDYSLLFSEDKDDLVLKENEELEDESDKDRASISKFMKGDLPPKGKDNGESSSQVAPSQNPDLQPFSLGIIVNSVKSFLYEYKKQTNFFVILLLWLNLSDHELSNHY